MKVNKYIVGLVVVSALVVTYYVTRKPKLKVVDADWRKKFVKMKFGNKEFLVSDYTNLALDEKGYLITQSSDGGKIVINLTKGNKLIESKKIDFAGRLIYGI